jgi:hypothetical protein
MFPLGPVPLFVKDTLRRETITGILPSRTVVISNGGSSANARCGGKIPAAPARDSVVKS